MKYIFSRKGMLIISCIITLLGFIQIYRFYIAESNVTSTIGKLSGVDVLVTGLGMLIFTITRKDEFFNTK
ncbi:MAG: hypothetical protein IPP08_10085 [Chlorobiota bacterium]|nr:hypothetical protein [Chlorobiota bacterium]QQS66107.1 MAG: hypothetical protein IPP08_10085 [Chlorobiota bacterium]